jgi:hypothetical protein
VLGGSGNEVLYSVEQTADGGYITVGNTSSNDGDVSGNNGDVDCWVVKLNSIGVIQWQKCLGGLFYDAAFAVHQSPDGSYVMAGRSNDDFWLVKLDAGGDLQWQQYLGGSSEDGAYCMQLTSDGGYIIAGYSYSNDGDVSGHHGGDYSSDYWVVKLDSNHNIQWQKSFGGNELEYGRSVSQTTDGGYIVGGQSQSVNNGDVTKNNGDVDFWVIKLTGNGDIQWQKSFGGSGEDILFSIKPTLNGGYIAAGRTTSNDGDVHGHHGGIYDGWIIKLNTNGFIEWQKCLGGTSSDWLWSVMQTSDKGYVAAGKANSNNDDVNGNHGADDFWIVKLALDTVQAPLSNPALCNQMYPNPAKQFFFIEIPGQEAYSVAIYDAAGRRIYVKQNVSGKLQVDCRRYASGVYFVSAILGNTVRTCKIVKIN